MLNLLNDDDRAAVRVINSNGACVFCALSMVNARVAQFAIRSSALDELCDTLACTNVRDRPLCVICFGLLQQSDAFWLQLRASAAVGMRGVPPVQQWRIGIAVTNACHVHAAVMLRAMQPLCGTVQLEMCDVKMLLKQRMLRALLAAQPVELRDGVHSIDNAPLEFRVRCDHDAGVALVRTVAEALREPVPKLYKHGGKRRRGAVSHDDRNAFFDSVEPSQTAVAPLLTRLGERIVDSFTLPLAAPCEAPRVVADFTHDSLWIGGRYNKWVRGVSQSPWLIGGQNVTRLSVEDCIVVPLLALFGTSTYALRAAGREDKDVRMLGNGRPFLLEVIQPKVLDVTAHEIAAAVLQINQQHGTVVSVRDVAMVDKASTSVFGNQADERRKAYRALVQTSAPVPPEQLALVNAMHDIVLQQRTPIRVAHRRANITREKLVHSVQLTPLQGCWYALELTTSSGTYVKEFVHGDLGRTAPSLATLCNVESAAIAQLDVTDVFFPYPRDDLVKMHVPLPSPLGPPPTMPLFTLPSDELDCGGDDGDDGDDAGHCD